MTDTHADKFAALAAAADALGTTSSPRTPHPGPALPDAGGPAAEYIRLLNQPGR